MSTLEATLLINQKDALLLDVREAAEFGKGHILNARNVPLGELDAQLEKLAKNKQKSLVVYCESGRRSAQATARLRAAGYENAVNLDGGLASWKQAGLPVTTD